MKYGINTLDDFNFKGKTVIARLDLNSPYDSQNNKLADTTRITRAAPTIAELSKSRAKLVLCTHQGGDLEYHNYIPTKLHSQVIQDLISKEVIYLDDVCGPAARSAISSLKAGEILLLDNVRHMAQEMTLFETKLKLSPAEQAKTIVVSKIAPLADIYVCDAFAAAHRDQPTLVGFEELLPSAMGRLFEAEYGVLSKIMTDPEKPAIFILGGAKIEDAFKMIPKVLSSGIADKILACGLLAQVFMVAGCTNIGNPSLDIIQKKKLDSYIGNARGILSKYASKIILPDDYAYTEHGRRIELGIGSLNAAGVISDIGSKTINMYKKEIEAAKTVFVNGPAGVFGEKSTELGTKELLTHIASSDSYSVIGGGDSVSAVNKYRLSSGFSYICTGGGAMVRFLSGEEIPVVAALKRAAVRF